MLEGAVALVFWFGAVIASQSGVGTSRKQFTAAVSSAAARGTTASFMRGLSARSGRLAW
jgi:hypothetical protein